MSFGSRSLHAPLNSDSKITNLEVCNFFQWGLNGELQTSRFVIFFNRVCMENYKPLRFVCGQMG